MKKILSIMIVVWGIAVLCTLFDDSAVSVPSVAV